MRNAKSVHRPRLVASTLGHGRHGATAWVAHVIVAVALLTFAAACSGSGPSGEPLAEPTAERSEEAAAALRQEFINVIAPASGVEAAECFADSTLSQFGVEQAMVALSSPQFMEPEVFDLFVGCGVALRMLQSSVTPLLVAELNADQVACIDEQVGDDLARRFFDPNGTGPTAMTGEPATDGRVAAWLLAETGC